VFSLSGESWIQVRDGEGAALYTGTGSAGTTRTVQGKPPFSIVVGNAGLVSLEYDGNPVDLAPHIRSGGVARMTLR
jgi:cytoskeleton protein RodZ